MEIFYFSNDMNSMKANGIEKLRERLREETGHSACTFNRSPEVFSGFKEWLEIICGDCHEKVSRQVSMRDPSGYKDNTEEDMHDPDVREMIGDMRKKFCKELDWNRIWF